MSKLKISIHIPRVGDDVRAAYNGLSRGLISIHIPRVGDDVCPGAHGPRDNYFNPHPPCGG